MRKLLSTILVISLVLSMSITTAFAATSVSEFTDKDYLTMTEKDYYKMRSFSINGKGVSWKDGATVIFGESGLFDGIYGAENGVWNSKPNYDSSVKEIKFPKSVVILGVQALDNRTSVTSVNFEELVNLKFIDMAAFNRVPIRTADLSNTKVINIEAGAFMGGANAALKTFVAPSTLKRIGKQVFSNQYYLSNITLNEGLETIEEGAFADCGAFTIPSTVSPPVYN